MPRTRYVEGAGTSMKDLLVKKNPWQELKGGCGRASCHICLSQGGKGSSCRREGVCYKLECNLCENGGGHKTWYIGESSRSAFERVTEHLWLFNKKKCGNPEKQEASSMMWIHSRDFHGGEMTEGDWKSTIISTHKKALERQVTATTRT